MRAIIVTAALLLGACAGETIRSRMTTMVGQPASVAIAKLGLPTEEQTIAGQHVYIWSSNRLVEGSSWICRIRAVIGANDTIKSFDLDGNEAGCEQFARRLLR